ncbi:hypothetical protein [Nautilia profundicola]|nr:hypothetical protein [Nautilia profundicola]
MIEYKINPEISVEDFIELLNRSGLGERRPVDTFFKIKTKTSQKL